jgi:hypothetical protein
MIIQPSKEEVYLPISGQAIPDLSLYLREELDKSGIEYLDLTPTFRRQAARGEKLFFESDPHPNAAGYALIASSVLAYLKERRGQAPESGWKASENITALLDHHTPKARHTWRSRTCGSVGDNRQGAAAECIR